MTQPSLSIQQLLCGTVLDMLQRPELTPDDREWLRRFATLMMAEFNLVKSNRTEPEAEETAA